MRAFQQVLIIAMVLSLIAHKATAQPATLRADAWATDGQVFDIEQSRGIIYIGGKFDNVIMNTGAGAALDMRTALPIPLARIDGAINAVVPDGAGGWYVGGSFTTKVDDFTTRKNLVHILSNGTLDLEWKPEPNARVHALALHGATLYVGGEFTKIDGKDRNNIAALNAATGQAVAWDPNATIITGSGSSSVVTATGATVRTLAVNGRTIYAGGSFTHIGRAARNYIAALDSLSGDATPWNPDANHVVRTVVVSGSAIYAGGNFTKIGRANRNRLAALEMGAGDTTAWNPNVEGVPSNLPTSTQTQINAIEVVGTVVYVGGVFTTIGKVPQNNIAAINAATGRREGDWNADANGPVVALAANGSAIYAAGKFTKIGLSDRISLAALDVDHGTALSWNPLFTTMATADTVRALAISGLTVYAGGDIKGIRVTRKNLAAFNASTGKPMAWNPSPNDTVYALAVSGATVYAGGRFTQIGAMQPRSRLAAIEAMTGNITGWNPNVTGARVNAIEVSNKTIYIGGLFTKINVPGQGPEETRTNLAALDSATGKVNPSWNPTATGQVRALKVRDAVVYVGGDFTFINNVPRNALAAINIEDGTVLEKWDPNVSSGNKQVHALAVNGSTVYVGGNFTTVGGQPHKSLVAINAVSGMPIATWTPDVVTSDGTTQGTVRSLELDGSTVYLGGEFNGVDGATRTNVAAVRAADGFPTGWIPEATAPSGTTVSITALEVDGTTVYVGGIFSTITGKSHANFAPLGETPLNPVPTVTSMSPTTGTRLQSLDVIFTGTNFNKEFTSVNVGSRIAVSSLTVLSSTRLMAKITITGNASTGVRNFVVSNNPVGGGSAIPFVFTVTNPAPTLQSIAPVSGLRGQTVMVTVAGSNFINGATTLNLGPDIIVTGVNILSATRLTATIKIGANAAIGSRQAAVSNAFPGGGTATLARAFAVNHSTPTLLSLDPAGGNRLQTLNVVFTGTGFLSDVTTVNVEPGIRINSTTVMSATSLTANLTITAQAATGPRAFSITNGLLGGGASESRTFTINNPAPDLTSLDPTGVGRGETRNVLLKGENFINGVTTISFGPDIIIKSITVKGDTQITANVAVPFELANGSRDVVVTNAGPGGGTASLDDGFDIINPRPILVGVTPAIGALGQTLEVELTGTNFGDGMSSVDFGEDITIHRVTVVGSRKITANITIENSAPTGGHDVSVTNDDPGGGTVTLSKAFAVVSGAVVQFSVPLDLRGGPGDTVEIPLKINPNGRRLTSFDAKLSFDPGILSYLKKFSPGPILSADWYVEANITADLAAVDIGAYTTNSPLTQTGTAVILRFRVNETAVSGTVVPLMLSQLASTNPYLSPLPNAGTHGLFTVQPATISGRLFYFVANKPLAGDTVIAEISGSETLEQISEAHGNFEFEAVPTGRKVVLTPHRFAGNFPEGTITAGDALQAFKGWDDGPQPLEEFERLAADVNGDCEIREDDALAILKRATGRWQSFRKFVEEDWRFVNADFNLNTGNLCEAPRSRVYEPFTEAQVEQNFVGVLLGDVNGSFGAPFGKTAAPQGVSVSLSNQNLEAGERQIRFAVEVSVIDQAYNSFDLKLRFDAAAIKIANVTFGDLLVAKAWQTDWNVAAPGVLRIAGFSMTEAAIQAPGTLVIIQATLSNPARAGDRLQVDMPFALFGRNGKETRAQTSNGSLQFTVKLPQQYALEQNYPNPFVRETAAATTIIKYALPQASMVELRIYDMLGNVVRTLVNKSQNADVYTVMWNGRKDNGAPAVSGVYFFRLKAGTFVQTNKLILQK